MSPGRPEYEVVDAPETAVGNEHARDDGSTFLTQRELIRLLFTEPAVRNYVIAGFSALVMMFLILFQQGSDLAGLLIVVIGVAGIVLRWTAAPAFVLLVLTYFMVFQFGLPGDAFENRFEIVDGRFRPTDLIMAMAVLVYMAAQFRIFGFVHQAIAVEGAIRRQDEPVTRRPPAVIASSEIGTLLLVSFVLVIVGQMMWMIVNSIEITPGVEFPFKWESNPRNYRRSLESGGLTPGLTRFVIMIGLMGFGVLFGRLVFGYWRLRVMKPAEGAMILQDDGWLETKRERSRLEKWRLWGRTAAAKTTPETGKKEERK